MLLRILHLRIQAVTQEVIKITDCLNSYNRERQEIEKRIFDEVIERIEKDGLSNMKEVVDLLWQLTLKK